MSAPEVLGTLHVVQLLSDMVNFVVLQVEEAGSG